MGIQFAKRVKEKRKEISEDLTKLEAIEEVDGLSNEQVIRKIWLVKENLALLNKTGATNLAIKYLGVPVSPSRLHVEDWLPLIEKNAKKLDVWKGGTMSIAGRSTLISSSLNNTPIYHMSIYLLPKTTVKNLDKIRRTFLARGRN